MEMESILRSCTDLPALLELIAKLMRENEKFKAKGRKDSIKELCEQSGVKMAEIAAIRLLNHPTITARQVAEQLSISERSLFRWKETRNLISREKRGMIKSIMS